MLGSTIIKWMILNTRFENINQYDLSYLVRIEDFNEALNENVTATNIRASQSNPEYSFYFLQTEYTRIFIFENSTFQRSDTGAIEIVLSNFSDIYYDINSLKFANN